MHEVLIYFDPKVLAIVCTLSSIVLALFKRKRAAMVLAVIAAFWTLVLVVLHPGFLFLGLPKT
jgi:hypothetical protein